MKAGNELVPCFDVRKGTSRIGAKGFGLVAAIALAGLLSCPGLALADESKDLEVVCVNDELTVVAAVDEAGIITLERAELNGEALPMDSAILDSEEVLLALAASTNGWYQSNTGNWYYFINGKWVTGWYKVDGVWYYFNPNNGIMQTGWVKVDSEWFYMDSSGAMQVGWIKSGGYWYYLAEEDTGILPSSRDYGKMVRGLRVVGLYEYYFFDPAHDRTMVSYPEGAMVTSLNYAEFFGSDGRIVYGQIDSEGHVYRHTIA